MHVWCFQENKSYKIERDIMTWKLKLRAMSKETTWSQIKDAKDLACCLSFDVENLGGMKNQLSGPIYSTTKCLSPTPNIVWVISKYSCAKQGIVFYLDSMCMLYHGPDSTKYGGPNQTLAIVIVTTY